jgi:DNA-binding NtrC family response regulator
MPGEPPALVWIIDDQQWPRAALRAELLERGYEAVGFRRILHALARLEDAGVARPAVVVLELRGQPQAVSTALLGALAETGLPVILLGGAVELGDPSLAGLSAAAVLRRPFTVGDVVAAVMREAPLGVSPHAPAEDLSDVRDRRSGES